MERISNMTPALRRVAHDYFIEGLSYTEIAEREDTSEAAIRKRIQRILEGFEDNGTA
jgi:DNA-directed RNA polymerase specialized sigma24 family protein